LKVTICTAKPLNKSFVLNCFELKIQGNFFKKKHFINKK